MLNRARQIIDLDVRRRDGRKPEDVPAIDGHVGDADVVAELILAGKLPKEPIEIGVARVKRASLVASSKCPDLNHAAGRATRVTASPSRSVSRLPDRISV